MKLPSFFHRMRLGTNGGPLRLAKLYDAALAIRQPLRPAVRRTAGGRAVPSLRAVQLRTDDDGGEVNPRVFVSNGRFRPENVLDFCHRRMAFLEGVTSPGLLTVFDTGVAGSARYCWVFVCENGAVHERWRDGGPLMTQMHEVAP